MNPKIKTVLLKLETQSDLEKLDKVEIPHDELMLAITKETGEFFNILLKTSKAKRLLEVGTSTGYSTLWFADALLENEKNNCNIITVEENPKKINRAKKNFQEAGVSNIIEIKQGKAINVLKELSNNISDDLQKFDFIFLDADKENMIEYFETVLPLVKPGGIIAADNILYPERFRKDMKKYSEFVSGKPNVQSVTVPIGNGEEISFKLRD